MTNLREEASCRIPITAVSSKVIEAGKDLSGEERGHAPPYFQEVLFAVRSAECPATKLEGPTPHVVGPGPTVLRQGFVVLALDHEKVLRAFVRAGGHPLVLEEIAAIAALTFEQAWYAVMELIELRFVCPAGFSVYSLTLEGEAIARQLVT